MQAKLLFEHTKLPKIQELNIFGFQWEEKIEFPKQRANDLT
jgi:hypothetical protein